MLLNMDRAIKIMNREGLDAIIATSPENITYSGNYFNPNPYIYKELELYIVIPADKNILPSFIVPIDALEHFAQYPSLIEDMHSYGSYHIYGSDKSLMTPYEKKLFDMRENLPHHKTPLDALIYVLNEKQLSNKCLGLDELSLSVQREEKIKFNLPKAKITPSSKFFREIRLIKTADQIDLLRRTAQILEGGIELGFEALENGGSEMHFAEALRVELAKHGAIPAHSDATIGSRSSACIQAEDYFPSRGEVMRVDVGCRYRWNYGDTGRTAVFGEPTPKHRKIFEAIMAGQRAALDLIKPGVHPSEIFNAVTLAVKREGLDPYDRHHVGHGIGFEMYELPIITPSDKPSEIHDLGKGEWLLESNMVINIETPYYEMGEGGFQIEDTLVVTDNGYEYLTNAPRTLRILHL
jgi:Xaa-Pro dipeptidase